MSKSGTQKIASEQELNQTLWHCHHCAALVAIYSADSVKSAMCPVCWDVALDPRGTFEMILGMTSEEPSHGPC
jgi:uncharacterized paraquat-inducible protein A